MITKEKTNEFIDRAYKCACEHGFHDKELSVEHYLMLVITEISEAVEADRNGRRAEMSRFKREYEKYAALVDEQTRFATSFEKYVKSSLEDELADVCIRLFDFCGTRGIEPEDFRSYLSDDYMVTWKDEFGSESVCEQCYELVKAICLIDDDSIPQKISEMIGAAILFCYCFAEYHGIDLDWHIEKKIEYNKSRPVKHGKKY